MTTPILLTNSATRTTTIYGLYKNLHYYGDKTVLADGYFQGNLSVGGTLKCDTVNAVLPPQMTWTTIPTYTNQQVGFTVTNTNLFKVSFTELDKNFDIMSATIPSVGLWLIEYNIWVTAKADMLVTAYIGTEPSVPLDKSKVCNQTSTDEVDFATITTLMLSVTVVNTIVYGISSSSVNNIEITKGFITATRIG